MNEKQKAAMRTALYKTLWTYVGHWTPHFFNKVVDELLAAAIAGAQQKDDEQ